MTEKIEWYKEVLELEPNSKVFFPLARLLSEAGRTDEAVEILEQGSIEHTSFRSTPYSIIFGPFQQVYGIRRGKLPKQLACQFSHFILIGI